LGIIRLRLEVAHSNQDGAATEGLVKTTPSVMWRLETIWKTWEGDKMKGISERYYSIRKKKRFRRDLFQAN
jgi:hypothetical protein